MPLSANQEPMTRRNAVALFSSQGTYGTAVTPATACGAVRASHNKQSATVDVRGPGSHNRLAAKGGAISLPWSLQIPQVQSGMKNLLLRGVRTAGILPLTTFGFGWKDDAGSPVRSADQIQDAKVGQLSLTINQDNAVNPISGSMSGLGGLPTELTSLNPASLTSTPWMSYEAVIQKDGSAWTTALRTFTLNVNHNLTAIFRIPTVTPVSFVRGHYALQEGNEEISGSITLWVPLGINVMAATLSRPDLSIVVTNLDDSATLTIALVDVIFGNENVEQTDTFIQYSADWTATSWSMS